MKFFVGIRNKGGPSSAQQQQDVVDTISLEDSSLYTSGLHTLTTNRSHNATSIIITTEDEEGTTISQKIRRHRYVSTDDTFGEASTLSDHFSSSYDGTGYLSSSSFMVGGGGRLPAITTKTTTNNASATMTTDPKQQQETPVKRLIPHFEGGPFSQGKTTTPEKAKSNPLEKQQQNQLTPTTMSRSSCHTYQTTPSHTTTKASPESATMTSVSSTSPSVPSFQNDTKTTTNTTITTPGVVDDDSKSFSDHDSLDSSLRGYLGVGMSKEGRRLHSTTNIVDSPTKQRILHTGQVPVLKDHSEDDISQDDNDSDWTPQIRNRQSNTLLISSPLLQDSQHNDDDDDIDSHRDPHSSWEDEEDDEDDKLYKWDNDDDNKEDGESKKKKEMDSLYDDDESTLAMTIASKVNMSDAELMDERNASPGALRLTEDGLKEHNHKYHHCNPWDNMTQEEVDDANLLSHVPSHHRTLPGFAMWKQQQQQKQQLNKNKVVHSKPLDNKDKNQELSNSQHNNKDDELEKRWKQQMHPITSSKNGTNPSTRNRHHTNLSRPLWILPHVPEEDTPTSKEDDGISPNNDTTRIIKTTSNRRPKYQFSTSAAKQDESTSLVVTSSSRQHRKPFSWIRRKNNNNNPRNPVVVTKNSNIELNNNYELSKLNEETCEEDDDETLEFQRIEQRRQAYLKHHRILEAQAKQKRLTSECNNHCDCNDKDNDNNSTNDNSINSQPNHHLLTFPRGSQTVLPILQIRPIVPTEVQNKNDNCIRKVTGKHTTRTERSPILPSFQKGHTNLDPTHNASRQVSSNPSFQEVDDVDTSDYQKEDKEDITPTSRSRIPISADLSNAIMMPKLDSSVTTTQCISASQSNTQQSSSKPISTLSLDLTNEEEENPVSMVEGKDDLNNKTMTDSIPYKSPAKLEVIQEELSTPSPSALSSVIPTTTMSLTSPCDMAATANDTMVSPSTVQTDSSDNVMSNTTPIVSNITSSMTNIPSSSSLDVINSTSTKATTRMKTMSAKEQRATTLTLETERHTENSIEKCLACGVYEPTHVALPCLHYGVCDDCATMEPRICPVCGPTTATKKQVRFSKVFF